MKKKVKTREEEISEIFLDLKKDLSNFKITVEEKDKTIQLHVKLFKLTKIEYQIFLKKIKD